MNPELNHRFICIPTPLTCDRRGDESPEGEGEEEEEVTEMEEEEEGEKE